MREQPSEDQERGRGRGREDQDTRGYGSSHRGGKDKVRETHEEQCPDRASYEKKAAQTSEIYNRHKNYIELVRDKKREKNAKFEISNAPSASNFPLLKYKYVMNEPFVAGTSAQN